MQSIRSKLVVIAALAMPLAVVGCGDAFGIGDGDLEGRYEYTGTVDGAPFYYVEGDIRVYNQRRDEADVDIRWVMRDSDGRTVYVIESQSPARAFVDRDFIRFDFEGWLDGGSGGDIQFVLEHEGDVRGRTMAGIWDLYTDGFGSDRGSFQARR